MEPLQDRSVATSKGGRRRLTACVAALAVVATPPGVAWASVPGSGLEGLGTVVADEELGEIRGKFVGSGGIAYFSVELRSSWTNAEGVTVAGVLAMSLDLRNMAGDMRSAVPVIMIGFSRDCATCDGTETGGSSTGGLIPATTGGLGSVHGVVQTHEIRGSDNTVQNGLRISVMPAHLVNGTMPGGLTPATGSSTQTLPGGGAVHFQITGSQLGVALQNGDQAGVVGQTVNAGQNQISQNVFLTSNMNTVHNSIGLTVGVDQMRQAELTQFQHSMSVLSGLGY